MAHRRGRPTGDRPALPRPRGRTGTWDGTVRGGPTPDGSYAFTVRRARPGRQPHRGAGVTDPPNARRPAPHGGRRPPPDARRDHRRRCPPARSRGCGSGRCRAASSSRSRAWARRASLTPATCAAAGACACASRTTRAHGRVRGPRARGRPARGVAGGGGGACPPRAAVRCGARARWWCCRWPRGRAVNRWDSDLDGFPDTLDERAAGARRPAVRRRQAARRPGWPQAAPLLEFLDRERLSYDLTTDVALARARGPVAEQRARGGHRRHRALGAAPAARRPATARSRTRGSRVASFGGRLAAAHGGRSSGDGCATPARHAPTTCSASARAPFAPDAPAPLNEQRDRLHLFRGTDRLFGDFSRFERSIALPDGRRAAQRRRARGGPARVRGLPLRQGHRDPPGHAAVGAASCSEERLGLEVPRITRNDLGGCSGARALTGRGSVACPSYLRP